MRSHCEGYVVGEGGDCVSRRGEVYIYTARSFASPLRRLRSWGERPLLSISRACRVNVSGGNSSERNARSRQEAKSAHLTSSSTL